MNPDADKRPLHFSGETEHTFDAADLSAGAYFYTIRAEDGRKAEGKLIAK